jgi:hypothetical protein
MSVARAKIDILSRNISRTLDTFDRLRLKRKLGNANMMEMFR